MKAYSAVVEGIVQGVGFRYSARSRAASLGVEGWVKNRSDGSVEIVCEGNDKAVDDFLAWMHRGPSGASVHAVNVRQIPFTGKYSGFSIRY